MRTQRSAAAMIFSARALANHDRATEEKVGYIRSHLAPESTVVLAGAELLVARYYLPEYTVWFSDDRGSARYERALAVDTMVVLFEERARPLGFDAGASVRPVAGLAIFRVPAGSRLTLRGRDVDAVTPP